jgi:hypothetical protein
MQGGISGKMVGVDDFILRKGALKVIFIGHIPRMGHGNAVPLFACIAAG